MEILCRPAAMTGPQLMDVHRPGRSILNLGRALEPVLHHGSEPPIRPSLLSGAGCCTSDGVLVGSDISWDVGLMVCAGFPREDVRTHVARTHSPRAPGTAL